MSRRGIGEDEVERCRTEGRRFIQRDGALVYLLQTEPGRYFFVVENPAARRIVTVSDRRVPEHEIERFIVRYGWRIPER